MKAHFAILGQPPPRPLEFSHEFPSQSNDDVVPVVAMVYEIGRRPDLPYGLCRLVDPENILDNGLRDDGNVRVVIIVAIL
jgi:hypothetical protein